MKNDFPILSGSSGCYCFYLDLDRYVACDGFGGCAYSTLGVGSNNLIYSTRMVRVLAVVCFQPLNLDPYPKERSHVYITCVTRCSGIVIIVFPVIAKLLLLFYFWLSNLDPA